MVGASSARPFCARANRDPTAKRGGSVKRSAGRSPNRALLTPLTKEAPLNTSGAFLSKDRRRPTLPHPLKCSTISAERLNYRVRDGNGCFPLAITAGNRGARRDVRHALTIEVPASPKSSREKVGQASRAISTARLKTLLSLHLRPINVVVSHGPSGSLCCGTPNLEVGFPLRCFQRLSLPHIATLRCSWRHNRYTSGASDPVLSY